MGSDSIINLDGIRTEQEKFMPDSVIIRRDVLISPDDRSKVVVYSGIARISSGYGSFKTIADRFQGITPYHITVPWDSDVSPGDEIISEDSKVFNVRSVHEEGSYLTAKNILVDLIS